MRRSRPKGHFFSDHTRQVASDISRVVLGLLVLALLRQLLGEALFSSALR